MDREVLRDVSFYIASGEKIGLVGQNGGGKSTLMRILANRETADDGTVQWVSAHPSRCAYLPQDSVWDPDVPLGIQLADVDAALLSRCGIERRHLEQPAAALSGGEKTRAGLAKAMSHQPTLLLLDEPTNHLDVDGLAWLESVLASFDGAVLVVSHDRYFLDHVVHRVLELDDGSIRPYSGNYFAYAQQKAAERRRQEELYAEYQRGKRRLEAALEQKRQWAEKGQRQARQVRKGGVYDAPIAAKAFYGASAKRMMAGARAIEQRIERLHADKPAAKVDIDATMRAARATGRHLIGAEDIGFHYPERPWLFRAGRFFVERGDRVAVVGANGSGKTTLVHLILGHLSPIEGSIRLAPVHVGYLAQEMETLAPEATLLDAVRGDHVHAASTHRARDILGHLLFRGDTIHRQVKTLSGGERVRLAFARLLFDLADLLVLDEPTNALDLVAREAVEEALLAYAGTVVFVSHDRYLLQRLATKVLFVDAGRLHVIHGGYEDYASWRADRLVQGRLAKCPGVAERGVDPAWHAGAAVDVPDGVSQRDRILLLETRLAVLSQRLAVAADDEKDALSTEFIDAQRQLRVLGRTRSR